MLISYKCTTCNKTTHLPKNTKGLDIFGRCVVTKHCKGSMVFVENLPNIIRYDTGAPSINDWEYTPQIFTFDQTQSQKTWRFKHKLNCIPSVLVYVDNQPVYDYEISINETSGTIKFKDSRIGTIQCIARNTTVPQAPLISYDPFIKISLNHQITLAIHSHNDLLVMSPEKLSNAISYYLNGNLVNYPLSINGANAWVDTSDVVISGNDYSLHPLLLTTDTTIQNNYSYFNYSEDAPIIYILLSNGTDPYDKNYNQFVLFSDLNNKNNYLKDNELFVQKAIIRNCYPPIKLV